MALPSQCADGTEVIAGHPCMVSMVGWEEFLALSWQRKILSPLAT
jgi:hypothetical protein